MTPIEEMSDLMNRYPVEFCRGFAEGLLSTGITYDDNPESDRSMAYDMGRTLREVAEESVGADA